MKVTFGRFALKAQFHTDIYFDFSKILVQNVFLILLVGKRTIEQFPVAIFQFSRQFPSQFLCEQFPVANLQSHFNFCNNFRVS